MALIGTYIIVTINIVVTAGKGDNTNLAVVALIGKGDNTDMTSYDRNGQGVLLMSG